MARNIEIKAAIADLDAIRRRVSAIASVPSRIIDQVDTFFVVTAGRLKVRQFEDGSGELIAYDRVDAAVPKTSNYSIVTCDEAGRLVEILAQILPVRGRVVKRRELFLVGRTRVHLDAVESLGCFVELEVVLRDDESAESGQHEAHDLMRQLGIEDEALIAGAYIDLLEERATIQPL